MTTAPNSAAPVPREAWAELIPHRGSMSLLDAVVGWDAQRLHACSASHRSHANPLLDDGVLRAVHLCEYGAQAMAIHGGLLAKSTGEVAEPGYLVSLRDVALAVARIDDLPGDLDVFVECLLHGAGSWQYGFRVEHRGSVLASGRAAVIAAAMGRDSHGGA